MQARNREHRTMGARRRKQTRKLSRKAVAMVSARREKRGKRKRLIEEMRTSAVKQPPNLETIARRKERERFRVFKRRIAKIVNWAERNGHDAKKAIGELFHYLGLHLNKVIADIRELAMKLVCANVKKVPIARYQVQF